MAAATLKDPFSHYDQVHQTPHGAVIVWERLASPGNRWIKIEPYHPAAALLGPLQGKVDVFLSANEFKHWRLIRNLKSLRACYVDLDNCTDWQMALDALLEARMPSPTLMVMSGRGIHFYWVLHPVPAQALPVWQRVQDALVHALAPIGSDPRAKDCTRMLRLVGTVNGKNGAEVVGRALTGAVWTLHELADEVLGPRPSRPAPAARVLDFKAGAARRKREQRAPAKGNIYQWWHLVYRDLCAIGDYHWLGGVPEGRRDMFLFLMANALSWFACPDALASEIAKTARTFAPSLTQRQVETYTKPVLRRAADAAAGKRYEWQGREVDPRYAFRSQTIREWLGEELIVPDLWPELRALAPARVIYERRQERDKGRDRVAEGRYADHNSGQGYRASNEQKRTMARLLKAQGRSVRQIAEELGVGKSTISDWVK